MLTLIPGAVGSDYKSDAEKKVFKWLKSSILSGYAFHSVGLPQHEKKSYSEADFIIVTRNGILCLEVKGGRVSCQNGVWEFEDRYGKTNHKNEGPFEQASGALFALKKALSNQLPWVTKASFASGVVFNDITFEYRGVSVIPEIIFDYSSTELFDEYMVNCHTYWDVRNHGRVSYLSESEMEQIKAVIRDDLHFVPSLGSIVNSIDEHLIRLTEEQVSILDSLEENDKILVNGPAGSGKTLLAMEYACRCSSEGKRVLFLTYNKMLAQYLSEQLHDESIVIKHFHGLISEYVSLDAERVNDPVYYLNVLPDKFLKVLSTGRVLAYDVLVVDEGQDLINTNYFPIFDKLLRKGLYGGRWTFFFDTNQNLFGGPKFQKALEALKKYNPVNLRLKKNCRNTEQIAKFNELSSGIASGETFATGEEVEIVDYATDDFGTALDKLLDNLILSDINASDIVFISPYSFEKSIISEYDGKYKQLIEKFNGHRNNGKIHFATIQSFKGLDSKIVLAVDTAKIIEQDSNIVLYTLLSRARAKLYIALDKDSSMRLRIKVIKRIG